MPSLVMLVACLPCLLASCGQERRRVDRGAPRSLPVDVLADTGRGMKLHVEPPAGAVWLAKVSPEPPPAHVRPAAGQPPLPAPAPQTLPAEIPEPPALEIDADLKPPILRESVPLAVPRGARRAWVALDVRVDELGAVSDALWAEGSIDSAQVAAAIACALGMRFYPALKGDRPIAVWCRQRFDFGSGSAPTP